MLQLVRSHRCRPVRPFAQSEPTAFNNIFHWFFLFVFVCVFSRLLLAARLSGACCQVLGYSRGHAHKESPPTTSILHDILNLRFTLNGALRTQKQPQL